MVAFASAKTRPGLLLGSLYAREAHERHERLRVTRKWMEMSHKAHVVQDIARYYPADMSEATVVNRKNVCSILKL